MRAKTVIVSVSNDLSIDQRVHRICNSLANNGFKVILVGRKHNKSKEITNRDYKVKRFKLVFNKGFLFYVNLNLRFLLFQLFTKSDILLSNDLDTLLCNTIAAKIKRNKLVYDTHELFTEVPELSRSKYKKKVWTIIERYCMKNVNSAYTVCNSIAEHYNSIYNTKMLVIRNLPLKKELIDDYETRENIIIYQGALNKERGIELLIESMSYLDNCKLIIAGQGYLENSFKNLITTLNLTEKINFLGLLDFHELYCATNTAILGFSIEQGQSLNYYFALPNKIFDYIQSGVPFICSDFPEMRNIINKYHVGEIFNGKTSEDLATQIQRLITDKTQLNKYHNNCITAAAELTWENEEQILLKIFKDL